jgi:hypothetical protein
MIKIVPNINNSNYCCVDGTLTLDSVISTTEYIRIECLMLCMCIERIAAIVTITDKEIF